MDENFRRSFTSLIGALMLVCLLALPLPIQAQQATWTNTGSLATGRTLPTVTLLTNGKVLAVGGQRIGTPFETFTSCELFDPATGLWSSTGSLATGRENHFALRLLNGKVLVGGGTSSQTSGRLASVEIYNPDTGAWSSTGSLNTARQIATATLLPNGKVLVSGGSGLGTNLDAIASAEIYDPATGIWTPTGSMSVARSAHTATLLGNGKVLVASGANGTFTSPTLHASAELYDPTSGTWSATGNLATARPFHKATILSNGRVLVFGGSNFTSVVFQTAELYDPITGLWSLTGSMVTPRISHTATVLPSGKVLVAGGGNTSPGVLKSAETYDPNSGTWSSVVDCNSPHQNHDATLLANGKVLVVGGQGSPNTAEIFDSGEPVSTIQFSSASLNTAEDVAATDITVTRFGDTSAVVSVEYATANGTASERSDYTTARGTLRFAAGETSKTISFLVNEDSLVEGNETLTINLSNAVGAAIGAPSMVAIQIADDVPETATNVNDDPATYVGQHYHDFLNRQADAGGIGFWTNEITSCGSDPSCIELKRINVSAAFFLSIEFQQTGYLVERIYKGAYGDATGTSQFGGSHQLAVPIVRFEEFLPDTQQMGQGVVVGQTGWEAVLESNKQKFAAEFVQRSRFITEFPVSMTPTQFVDKLNNNAGSVLSAGERATAIGLFVGAADSSSTTARGQALRQVAEDPDLVNSESNRAFVLMQYYGYLRRNPNDPQDTDYTGYDFWLTKLIQFNGNFVNAEMVKAFISSGEYRHRFGQ